MGYIYISKMLIVFRTIIKGKLVIKYIDFLLKYFNKNFETFCTKKLTKNILKLLQEEFGHEFFILIAYITDGYFMGSIPQYRYLKVNLRRLKCVKKYYLRG